MDLKQIQSMIKYFEKSNLTEMDFEFEDVKLRLSKNGPLQTKDLPKAEIFTPEVESPTLEKVSCIEVKSPLVGTFYEGNSPTSKPFVQVGDFVKTGQTLCIIEAMKIMNEITSPVDGTIKSIHVKNASPVGYDQLLMVIE